MLCPTRLLSMHRETAKKEAWRRKCVAPRLVFDFALFGTLMRVYVRMYCVPILP